MYNLIKHSLREYKKDSIKTPLIVIIEVILETLIPFIVSELVNHIEKGSSLTTIIQYGSILITMAVACLIFGGWAGITAAKASTGFAKNLRKDMFYKVQGYDFENIDKYQSSSLVTRMTTDISNVQNAYLMLIRTAIRSPIMLFFAAFNGFIIGGSMAWLFVLLIPLLGLGLYFIFRTVIPIFRRIFKKYDKVNESVQENVRNMRVVKAFVREDYEIEKFNRSAEELYNNFTKVERIMALTNPLMQFWVYVINIVVMTFGSYIVINSMGLDLNVGQMSALLTYSIMILNSLAMLSMVFVMLTMAGESAVRIRELLTDESSITNPKNPIHDVKDGSIDFENVTFKYSKQAKSPTLKEVNLSIKSGEFIGILGGTGSSKSTLVQLIPRLYDVNSGSIRVGGVDVRDYHLKSLRDNIGMVLQKNVLFSGTIRENLLWGNPHASEEEIIQACRIACADEFINRFPKGYDTYIEQGGSNVSGGQKQRLCIARALLKRPKILIMDDSTSAVDTKTDAQIKEGLDTYMPETTKIIISQRVSSVQEADRIVILDSGMIQDVGTHDELLERNPIYQEMYTSQNKAGATLND